MPSFTITANNDLTTSYNHRAFQGETVPVSFDFSPWADDNEALTSAQWIVENGQAAISGQSFASNKAEANITMSDPGSSLIKVVATNGTLTKVAYLNILAADLNGGFVDYR